MTKISKSDFTGILKDWLENFLTQKYGREYNISVLAPYRTLNRLNVLALKKLDAISFFVFKPNLLGILECITDGSVHLVFLNRELRSFSLKDIGEMLCYCRIAKPVLALMASTIGLASQIDKLINHNKRHDIIAYYDKTVKIFRWDTVTNKIDKLSITPLEERELFD